MHWLIMTVSLESTGVMDQDLLGPKNLKPYLKITQSVLCQSTYDKMTLTVTSPGTWKWYIQRSPEIPARATVKFYC